MQPFGIRATNFIVTCRNIYSSVTVKSVKESQKSGKGDIYKIIGGDVDISGSKPPCPTNKTLPLRRLLFEGDYSNSRDGLLITASLVYAPISLMVITLNLMSPSTHHLLPCMNT